MRNLLILLLASSLLGAGCSASNAPYTVKFTSATPSTLEREFEVFLAAFFTAVDQRDKAFLSQVYNQDFFTINGGYSKEAFDALLTSLTEGKLRPGEITIECVRTKCNATNFEGGQGRTFTKVGAQWIGYDVEGVKRQQKVKEALQASAYDYQMFFAGWGPVKYTVLLNNNPIQDLENYKNGESRNFLPSDFRMGENILTIRASLDRSHADFSEERYKKGSLQGRLSYSVQRFLKGNSNPYAIFDEGSIVVQSGKPEDIVRHTSFDITEKEFKLDVPFRID